MQISTLSARLRSALLEFVWDEWAQMGLLTSPRRDRRWAQDPEALLLMTFEVARDDPRLFDEVLDWLVRNEPLVSLRRLRTLCEGPEDERLSAAAIEWMQRQRRPSARGPQLSVTTGDTEPLFRRCRPSHAAHRSGVQRVRLRASAGRAQRQVARTGPHRADQLCVPAPSTAWHRRPRRGRPVPPDGRHRIRLGSGRRKVIGLLKAQRAGGADLAECRGSRRHAGVRWWRAALCHRPLPLGASLGSRTARASDLPRLAHVVWSIAPDPALAYASGARRSSRTICARARPPICSKGCDQSCRVRES